MLPAGTQPGQNLTVSAPDGRLFTIVIPPGCHAGQTINVVVDNNVASGSTTQLSHPINDQPIATTDPSSNRAALGAAGLAAVAGALMVGPVTGVCVAGAALYATTRNDEVGTAARQAGSAACYAFDAAKKYGVFDKIKTVGAATLEKAQQINNEHRVTERVTTAVTDFDREHQVTQRVTQAALTAAAKTPGMMSAVMKMASSASSSGGGGAGAGAK